MTEARPPLPLSRVEAIAELNRVIAELDEMTLNCRERLWCCLVDVACRDTVRAVMSQFDEYHTSLSRRVPELAELKVRYPEAWDLSAGGKRDREVQALRAWLAAGTFETSVGRLRPVNRGRTAAGEHEGAPNSTPQSE